MQNQWGGGERFQLIVLHDVNADRVGTEGITSEQW